METFKRLALLLILIILSCASPTSTLKRVSISSDQNGTIDIDGTGFIDLKSVNQRLAGSVWTNQRGTLVYPPKMYHAKIEGHVSLRIFIDSSGKTVAVSIFNGDSRFFDSAVQYASSWKFNPLVVDNIAKSYWVNLKINFELAKS